MSCWRNADRLWADLHATPSRADRIRNLKELRPLGTNLRILFVFDPRRTAILLVGGDKTGRWQEWYDEMIPVAERLYEEHLEELREQGELR